MVSEAPFEPRLVLGLRERSYEETGLGCRLRGGSRGLSKLSHHGAYGGPAAECGLFRHAGNCSGPRLHPGPFEFCHRDDGLAHEGIPGMQDEDGDEYRLTRRLVMLMLIE